MLVYWTKTSIGIHTIQLKTDHVTTTFNRRNIEAQVIIKLKLDTKLVGHS